MRYTSFVQAERGIPLQMAQNGQRLHNDWLNQAPQLPVMESEYRMGVESLEYPAFLRLRPAAWNLSVIHLHPGLDLASTEARDCRRGFVSRVAIPVRGAKHHGRPLQDSGLYVRHLPRHSRAFQTQTVCPCDCEQNCRKAASQVLSTERDSERRGTLISPSLSTQMCGND